MPLELGGSPADPFNLSPEVHPGAYAKDAAENAAKAEVCARADLRTVQAAFVARWLAPYPATDEFAGREQSVSDGSSRLKRLF